MLRGFVAYERINYLMLMMVDPDVHFHVIPRYTAAAASARSPSPMPAGRARRRSSRRWPRHRGDRQRWWRACATPGRRRPRADPRRSRPHPHDLGKRLFAFDRLDRYALRLFVGPLALVLATLLVAQLLERLLRLFDLAASAGAPLSSVLVMAANLVPHYLGLALPTAFTAAIFIAAARLSDDSELDIMLSTGPLDRPHRGAVLRARGCC